MIHKKYAGRNTAFSFIRVHKSYIVARNCIIYLEGNCVRIEVKNIPAGASYREAWLHWLHP